MKRLCFLLLFLTACKQERKANTSFYYWKTVYQINLTAFHLSKLYVRIMDVDTDRAGQPVPVSPIIFKSPLPSSVKIVPVVFIVNDMLRSNDTTQLKTLAAHIIRFVDAKIKQAGKRDYQELQVDCDWTAKTRDPYFFLLRQLSKTTSARHQLLSATLRLHQLKNQQSSGIPPVGRVMLMCYNMGNLRKYGSQNSILELSELKKYLGPDLTAYPLPEDIGLPLFNWAVAFRNKAYIGLSKKLDITLLNDKNQFRFIGGNLYRAVNDLPQYGLLHGDEIRWESVAENELNQVAKYISPFLKTDSLTVIYFHLDNDLIKAHPYAELEKTTALFR